MSGPDPDTGAPFELPVELGKVREFVTATGGDLTTWAAAGTAPPTFLATARLWQDAAAAVNPQGDTARLLHAGQEYVFHGPPPRVGDVLTGRARVSSRYRKEGRRGGAMEFTEVTTDFHAPDGRLVASAITTTVITGRAATTEASS